MDTSRISFGEMVAAASGVALFIFMFLPWYGVEDVEGSLNAWEALSFIDIVLFLVVVVAVGVAVARAGNNMPSDLPAPPGTIVMLAGALAVLLIVFRLIVTPDLGGDVAEAFNVEVDTTRKIGIFLALIAAAGIAFGGYTATNERAEGTAPPAGPAGGTPDTPTTAPAATTPPATTPSSGGTGPTDPPPA